MNPSLVTRRSWVIALALVLLSLLLLLLLPWNPTFKSLSPDSGLFAYGGREILSGRLLYVDVWDNKPPGVFYVNALAQIGFGSTPWAVWRFQLIWMGTAVLSLFLILSRLTGVVPGFVASFIFLLTLMYPDYFLGGNFTEVYALLPQVLALGAAAAFFNSGRARWFALIGLMTAAAFLFKPTYIALGLGALIAALIQAFRLRNGREWLNVLLLFIAGGLLPILPVLLYWGLRGALGDLLFAVILYNQQYVQEQFSLRSLYGTARIFFVLQPLAAVSAISAASAVMFIAGRILTPRPARDPDQSLSPEVPPDGGSRRGSSHTWLMAAVFLAIPLEIAFVSISGRNFGHYFITPLPAMAAAAAFLFREMGESLKNWRSTGVWPLVFLSLVAILGTGWLLEVLPKVLPDREQLRSLPAVVSGREYLLNSLDQYILEHTGPDESVLVWGIHPGINFRTNRRYPARYPFAMHLITPFREGENRFDLFMQDIRQDPPALILAQPQSSSGIPFFDQEADKACPGCPAEALQGLRELREYVGLHYTPVEQIGEWQIYMRLQE